MTKAKYVQNITVTDPDTNAPVEISIYKHENGGMFGIDSSYIEQAAESFQGSEDSNVIVPDVFDISQRRIVELTEN